ncbi:MAG: NYN domain-containing protein [Proteobacteria bacterium]|nr:NYN domain-containing protein [Pseudomonadota bacterium]MBU1450247.1 NYN domain-containing protein [Pseudomonadota bacterium]MBU2467159.1 NYN domain-containing protein [Pseudomonadota bacterium]MBU2516725.1 NYN domain-containing protein [Pseudomonadota bacterium]
MTDSEHTLAVFIDFENLALGLNNRKETFDAKLIFERLVEKGKVVVKKAYADWSRYSHYKHQMHELAVELIEIPKRSQTGKNSADIRLVVDAIDLCYSKSHVDTFVIVSGDSDFSPLVSKLKENGKRVIGLGMKASTSDLLRDNCDEFVYYEDLERQRSQPQALPRGLPKEKQEVFQILVQSLLALQRENKEVIYASMVKDTMKRKQPSFDESYHGYRSFSDLLLDAEAQGIITLNKDARSGTYTVASFGAAV